MTTRREFAAGLGGLLIAGPQAAEEAPPRFVPPPTPTAASKVGILYSTVNKYVRAHLYADFEEQFLELERCVAAQEPCGLFAVVTVGTTLTYVPMSAHHAGHAAFDVAVAEAVGIPIADLRKGRCAVIDHTSCLVEQAIMADALIDTFPDKMLVNDEVVDIGDIWDPATKQFTSHKWGTVWSPSGTIGEPDAGNLSA